MSDPLHIRTTVLPGHRIEIEAPGLTVGEVVEVTVAPAPAGPTPEVAPATTQPPKRESVLDIIQSLNGYRHFKTAEEVDEYIRAERDSWER